MTHITTFKPSNSKPKMNAHFTLDNNTNTIWANFINKSISIELHSNIILSEYDKCTFMSDLELVTFFNDSVIHDVNLFKEKDTDDYYLKYKSKTGNLTLHLYTYNDYIEKIKHKLYEIIRKNDLLIKGKKKL